MVPKLGIIKMEIGEGRSNIFRQTGSEVVKVVMVGTYVEVELSSYISSQVKVEVTIS